MNYKKSIRDPSVELARVFGCLIVIACHTIPTPKVNGIPVFGRVFLSCLFGDGVAVFWLLMGFFLFDRCNNVLMTIKRTIKRIAIPLLLFSVFTFYFRPWLVGNASLINSIMRPRQDYIDAFKAICIWEPISGAGHLWYLYLYIMVIATLPAMKGLIDFLDNNIRYWVFYLIIISILFSWNLFTHNNLMKFSRHTIGALFPAIIEVIVGYIYYRYKHFAYRFGLLAPITIVIINLLRTILYFKSFTISNYWYTFSGLLNAIFFVSFAFAIDSLIHSNTVKNIICKLGSLTFYIYLFHLIVRDSLDHISIYKQITDRIISSYPNMGGYCLYTLFRVLTVFAVSLLCASLLTSLIKMIKKTNH